MAGHSHAKNVKRTKDADAKKRSLVFAKIGRNISLLAKYGNIDSNPALRSMIKKAKEMNVPKDNIEKAIKKGTGELKGCNLEEFLFEAYGPEGIAIIVEGITDNKNRSIAKFKKILNNHKGKMVEPGSVKWLFQRKGLIVITDKNYDEAGLIAIELGAEDVKENKIITKAEDLEKIRKDLTDRKFKVESSLIWIPTTPIEINEKKIEKMIEELNSNEDIQKIYLNIKNEYQQDYCYRY